VPKFPEPPAQLTVGAITTTLPAGVRLWRVYFTGGQFPAAWNGFRSFGPTKSRFDHHDPPPRVQTKGILYAARNATTCIAEVFQASRTVDRASNAPWLVGFEAQRDLQLLDLAGVWPTRAGASMALNTGPRSRARRWSILIYAAYPHMDGLVYPSSMHANQPAVALYERAQNAMPAAPVFNRALGDPALLHRLNTAATRLGYRLV
jgi:hypothetical protein